MGAAAIPLVKRSVYGLIVRMRRGTVAYIGGSDLLPAPLTREEEEAMVRRSDNGDTRARARGLRAAAAPDCRACAEAGLLPQHDFRAVPRAGLYRKGHAETGSQAC